MRFATDTALLALVAQRRVEVFGWAGDAAWKLSSARGVLSFSPATPPTKFHNMAPSTVPAAIIHAFEATARSSVPGKVTWGVTLPADTARQLDSLLRKHDSGTLLIHATGQVRHEKAG